MVGGDEATTVSTKAFIDNEKAQAGRDKLVLSLLTKSKKKTGEVSSGVMVRYTYECKMRSFEEFAAQPNVDKLADQIVVYEWDNAGCSAEKLAASKGMSDLSDAMKIWVINRSNYFACHKKRTTYGMVYNKGSHSFESGWKGMKKLYENKADGACLTFARYELIVFRQMGITSYLRDSRKIAHAWSVAKVKNSEGKTLWIPFDYGIGPNPFLQLGSSQKKYVDTEAKRYKLYLAGVEGAPKKRTSWEVILISHSVIIKTQACVSTGFMIGKF
jgi:hypothetical protein